MRKLIYLILTICMPVAMSAQALPFTATDYSPVTAAKGGAAAVETSSIAYAAFTNPAAITFSDVKGDFAAGYTLWQPSSLSTTVYGVSGAYNINQKFGIAAGFNYGSLPGYEILDEAGTSKGEFSPSQYQLAFGFSWRFSKYLALGVNLGYAGQSLTEKDSYGAFASDIFAMTQIKGFKAALGLSNLGTKVTSVSGGEYPLPSSLKLGLGYGATFASKHNLEVNADMDYYFQNAFTAALGAGYTYNDLLSLRAGYRYGGESVIPSYASFGLGLKFFGITLDAAYLVADSTSPMRNTMMFGIGYRF